MFLFEYKNRQGVVWGEYYTDAVTYTPLEVRQGLDMKWSSPLEMQRVNVFLSFYAVEYLVE